jgi:serine protease Do
MVLVGNSASSLAGDLAVVTERLQRSTVHVRSSRWGAGSGVIWTPDGTIITNAHVVREDRASVELWDGRELDARVIDRDRERDLASLSVEAHDLPAAQIGDSDGLRVGQLVLAVGNPLGVTGALTTGIIHAIGSDGRSQRWIQADIRLLPGNSGGPMADAGGRVVGINSMISGGLGIAVPSRAVKAFLGRHGRPALGLTLQPVSLVVEGRRRGGLVVLDVLSNGPADRAGLMVGDVVLNVDGQPIGGPRDLGRVLDNLEAERPLRLDVLRGGTWRSVALLAGGAWDGEERAGEAA